MKEQNSYIWLDWVRTIGIYCVVLGHLAIPVLGQNWIYAFHMPLFFFISGFLFKTTKNETFILFLKKKLKGLLLPYLLFNILTYIVWIIKMQVEPDESVDFLNVFCQIFYGGILPHNTPLWFLVALFLVEIVSYIPLSKGSGWWLVAVFYILSWLTQYIGWIPLYIDAAIVGVQFYAIAYMSKTFIVKLLSLNMLAAVGLLLLLLISTCCISQWNGRVDMMSNHLGYNYFLFGAGAIVGIIMVLILGRFCENIFGRFLIVEYISRNTLVILALHITVIRLFKGIFMVTHINDSVWSNTFFNALFAVAVMIVLLPVIFMFKRYAPWVLGK